MVKLQLRMVIYLAQDHVACKWPKQASNTSQLVYLYPLSLTWPFLFFLYSFYSSHFERGIRISGQRDNSKEKLQRGSISEMVGTCSVVNRRWSRTSISWTSIMWTCAQAPSSSHQLSCKVLAWSQFSYHVYSEAVLQTPGQNEAHVPSKRTVFFVSLSLQKQQNQFSNIRKSFAKTKIKNRTARKNTLDDRKRYYQTGICTFYSGIIMICNKQNSCSKWPSIPKVV